MPVETIMDTIATITFYVIFPIVFGMTWAFFLKPSHWFRSTLTGATLIVGSAIGWHIAVKNASLLSFGDGIASYGFVCAFGLALLAKGMTSLFHIRKR